MNPAPLKPQIPFETFSAVDIRVGTIEKVENVPASEKLVRLTVSFGDHTRRVLAGLRQERANPAEIAGCQALFVVNLPPRRMAGEVSEGMLLDLGFADGILPRPPVVRGPLVHDRDGRSLLPVERGERAPAKDRRPHDDEVRVVHQHGNR